MLTIDHLSLLTIRSCCSAYLSLLVFLEISWVGLPLSSRTVLSWWPMVPLGPGGSCAIWAAPRLRSRSLTLHHFNYRSGTLACGWGCPQSIVCRRFSGLRPLLGWIGHTGGRGNKPGC